MPRIQLIRLRRDIGTPANGALDEGEPAYDMTALRPRLLIGDTVGAPVVLADPTHVANLESRIVGLEAANVAMQGRVMLLERALRELQFIAWTGQPTFVMPTTIVTEDPDSE